jgi:hypothetical protein
MPTPMPASSPDMRSPRVAYVMNAFPRLSETFIAHEIHQLERLGLDLRCMRSSASPNPRCTRGGGDPRAAAAPAGRELAVGHAAGALAAGQPGRLLARPRQVATRTRCAGLARWAARSAGLAAPPARRAGRTRLRKVFVKEFLQAGAIAADVLRRRRRGHLHGHFCHGVATITWLASALSGLPYSFTAHAKDIYQAELNPGDLLERKMAGARFVATCTCANADVLRARHPRPCEVHTIYHGLDTDWFSPAAAQRRRRPGAHR